MPDCRAQSLGSLVGSPTSMDCVWGRENITNCIRGYIIGPDLRTFLCVKLCKIVIIFLRINPNIYCGWSKELSHWDGFFMYPQHIFGRKWNKIIFNLIWRPVFINLFIFGTKICRTTAEDMFVTTVDVYDNLCLHYVQELQIVLNMIRLLYDQVLSDRMHCV